MTEDRATLVPADLRAVASEPCGRRLFAWLRQQTIEVDGIGMTDDELRALEGRRSLVRMLERMRDQRD